MENIQSELKAYREIFDKELHGNILAYWMKYGVEATGDGFYGAVDMENRPVTTANKTCVLNARILWTFAAAAKMFDNAEYGKIADRALNVVLRDFQDHENGGFFMEITPDNKVANDIKHTYAQAFVIYALCKYYEYNPDPKVMQVIQDFFVLLESKTKDPKNAGYGEAFTRTWQPYDENRMADNNEPRSMNTHLHMLEAYSSLYKVWKDDRVKARLTELLNLFTDKILRPTGHFGIFFDLQFGESPMSVGINSFGHDIEGSWLLWEAAEILGDTAILDKLRPMVTKTVDAVERVGVDKDGGLFIESYRFGSHVRTNKHWWPQAETLVGFMNAYELTGDKKYWDTMKLSWNFIDTCVIDHVGGEWFTKVNRLGVPFIEEPADDPSPYYRNDWKIDPWKCPYHNGRAMMEMIQRIDKLAK